MAYRYYPGFGLGQDAMKEGEEGVLLPQGFTSNPDAYIQDDATPSPSDLDLAPKVDDSVSYVSPSPVVTLPAMTTNTTQQAAKFLSADGVMGIPWKWVLLGGAVAWFVRSKSSTTKVSPNRRRRRRSRR
jgi:hypothetical protein